MAFVLLSRWVIGVHKAPHSCALPRIPNSCTFASRPPCQASAGHSPTPLHTMRTRSMSWLVRGGWESGTSRSRAKWLLCLCFCVRFWYASICPRPGPCPKDGHIHSVCHRETRHRVPPVCQQVGSCTHQHSVSVLQDIGGTEVRFRLYTYAPGHRAMINRHAVATPPSGWSLHMAAWRARTNVQSKLLPPTVWPLCSCGSWWFPRSFAAGVASMLMLMYSSWLLVAKGPRGGGVP